MTKVGGRIILLSPSSNHLDHGFSMFSPTLFCDFFAANKLEVEKSYLVHYSPNPSAAWSVYQYRPREWDALQIGGLDGRPYLNFMVARKTADSTNSEIPQQSVYARRQPNTAVRALPIRCAIYRRCGSFGGTVVGRERNAGACTRCIDRRTENRKAGAQGAPEQAARWSVLRPALASEYHGRAQMR
ncbi:MAG TPA: hypothetical protein VIG56_11955 [Pseudolabrys sp.]